MSFSDTHTISRKDFEEFGRRIGLPERVTKLEIDLFAKEQPLVKELLSHSFLSAELQKQYWLSFQYRRSILY